MRRLRWRYSVEIPLSCKIDKELTITHLNSLAIAENGTIGENAMLRQGVTIGRRSLHPPTNIVIGNSVAIDCNSTILGGEIVIGDNVTIGANVQVLLDIPDNAHHINNITPIISTKSSNAEDSEVKHVRLYR